MRSSPPSKKAVALAAEHYFAPHELDERPLILSDVEPRFPAAAGDASGRVRLRLYIGANGTVDKADVLGAEPAGLFEAAATEAFSAARFRPGMRRGAAVNSTFTLELFFGAALPADPRLTHSAQGERLPAANPNAADAPDRAGVKQRQRTPREPS